jgi:hypothetical protein
VGVGGKVGRYRKTAEIESLFGPSWHPYSASLYSFSGRDRGRDREREREWVRGRMSQGLWSLEKVRPAVKHTDTRARTLAGRMAGSP